MAEEHQHQETTKQEGALPAKGLIAKMLLGKIVRHKFFSDPALFWFLIGITFLLPVFFIPSPLIAPEFAKMILLEVVVLLGVFAWAVSRLRDGHVEVPKSLLLLALVLLVLQFVVSAIASPSPLISFFGSGYDLGTVNMFVILVLLLFLSSLTFTNRDRVLFLYASFLFSGILLMVYHLARYFIGPDFLGFGIFTNAAATPVGKLNDFAALVGGLEILVLTTLYFFSRNKLLRIPAYLLFVVGVFFLLMVNFTILWAILLVMLVLLVGLAVFEGERAHTRKVADPLNAALPHVRHSTPKRLLGHLPGLAIALLLIAFVYTSGLANFPFGKNNFTLTTFVAKVLHAAPYSEVVLTPKSTFDVVVTALRSSPFFGTGPNRFASNFLLHKPSEINQTAFWDTSFEFGLGRIPTYFGTTGFIGIALWLFFIMFLFMKIRHLMKIFSKDRIAAYLAFSLSLLVLYFWSIAFFYLPNIAIFALAFLFTGALVAFLVSEGALGKYRFSFNGRSRRALLITPIFIVVIIGSVAGGVLLYRQVASVVLFGRAQQSLARNDIDAAEQSLIRANTFMERDLYLRALSNIALLRLSTLAKENLSPAALQTRANELITLAQGNAGRALTLDPTNFENELQMGGVFDTLGSLGIQGTFSLARQHYENALMLNPKSPRVLFMLARLAYAAGDREQTKSYLVRTLTERPNYVEAVSLLVQIDLQDKNPDAAIAVVENGVAVEPTNFLLHFALGYLYFGKQDYASSIPQFEAAVMLNPVYADAKYFLALSYVRVSRVQEAIHQLNDVLALNPGNKDILALLHTLQGENTDSSPSTGN